MNNIRNFCIIAHIDHGKSTLADRFLELTHTVEDRKMQEQLLDTMSLERERGITIKLQPVRMGYELDGKVYHLHLIDTPGHVDFTYEVSRTLKAVEGAILLVDAVKGIQAQTLSNLYLAFDQNLTIIPAINKIDLPNARVEEVEKEIKDFLGKDIRIHKVSAKEGTGVEDLLRDVVESIPAPISSRKSQDTSSLKALVFDSFYDDYKGVVACVRIFEGSLKKGEIVEFAASKVQGDVKEVGVFKPWLESKNSLEQGEIGYIVTGLKSLEDVRVGDTVFIKDKRPDQLLEGYEEPTPVVFASVFPQEGDDYDEVKEALYKLRLSDSSIEIKTEYSNVLGRGFRLGLLGRLHLEIVKERLKRESGVDVIVTQPSVAYKVLKTDGEEIIVKSAADMPEADHIEQIWEPWTKVEIVTPIKYKGAVFELLSSFRSEFASENMLGLDRTNLIIKMPLSQMITSLHDNLKSVSSGYASFSYDSSEWREADLARMDVLLAEEKVEAFSRVVLREDAHKEGKKIVDKLSKIIPRQSFAVKIQAAIGGKIVARADIRAYRKDVLAKLYGGDVTRKKKLLEKQKKGKKRMMGQGKIKLSPDVFLKAAIDS